MEPNAGHHEEFISEPIEPRPGSFDAVAMGRGEPGLPAEFAWRGRQYRVAALVTTWKTSGTDAGETYLRRHWYKVQTTTGERMTLYCERHPKTRAQARRRWWLYSIETRT